MLAGKRSNASSTAAIASLSFPRANSALIFNCRQGSLQPSFSIPASTAFAHSSYLPVRNKFSAFSRSDAFAAEETNPSHIQRSGFRKRPRL